MSTDGVVSFGSLDNYGGRGSPMQKRAGEGANPHRPVFLLSLPHTGTRFLLDFLAACPGAAGVTPMLAAPVKRQTHRNDRFLVHWTHLLAGSSPSIDAAVLLTGLRPLVPLRDPLAVAISHHARGSRIDRQSWNEAPERFDKLNAALVPLDLASEELTAEKRAGLLGHVLLRGGLPGNDVYRDDVRYYIHDFVATWRSRRETWRTSTPLHAAYAAGDVAPIKKALPDAWEWLRYSRPAQKEIKPWLNYAGYSNLLW